MKNSSRGNTAITGAESWRGHVTKVLAGLNNDMNHRSPIATLKRAGRAIAQDDWQDFQQLRLQRGGGDNGAVQFGLLGNPSGV